MAVEEIPKAFKYICDCCGKEHIQANAAGHYTNSRPPHWSVLKLIRAAEDFQGAEVADASIEKLLCPSCVVIIAEAVNTAQRSIPLA